MQKYRSGIQQLLATKDKDQQLKLTAALLAEVKMNHTEVSTGECLDPADCPTAKMLRHIIGQLTSELLEFLREFLEMLYFKNSPMLAIVYQVFPLMLKWLIQSHDHKHAEMEGCLRVVSLNESQKYHDFVRERGEQANSQLIKNLYSIHFNQPPEHDPPPSPRPLQGMQEEERAPALDRRLTKTVMLFTLYRNVDRLGEGALRDYLEVVYVYCGGDSSTHRKVSSFYLLEKKNLFNVFKYSVSEQELEWMLLCLYELSVDCSRLKYELLAAIHMIYKKTANESMFRCSEIAQSIIHTLEDEYADIFA